MVQNYLLKLYEFLTKLGYLNILFLVVLVQIKIKNLSTKRKRIKYEIIHIVKCIWAPAGCEFSSLFLA
ncbi:hypothetical protein BpHYR1_007828 [Brachionus plicatilis]|uniref:Uncharacterized protein n=1 Tax=Brachionus plicatilis TaxID=10195 RepID=A0A3M7T4I7_BRAPC|nr:hypothetical protein BpHYR1_007828 [Brachionus plicatilis]